MTERKLGNHADGTILEKSVRIISSNVLNGIRNVTMTRPYKGKSPDHYTFDPEQTSVIPHITASGTGPDFAYHGPKTRGGASLQIYTLDSPTCLCNAGVKGTINGIPFSKNCLEEPQADLLQQKNPTCWVDTYQVNIKHFPTIIIMTNFVEFTSRVHNINYTYLLKIGWSSMLSSQKCSP